MINTTVRPGWSRPERGQSGELLADHQLVDLRGALVGQDGLQVGGVPHHRVLAADPVGAEDRAALAGDRERLSDVVELADADLLRPYARPVGQPPQVQG